MRFISSGKDLRVIKGEKKKDNSVAEAIGKLTLMFSSLVNAISKRPAPPKSRGAYVSQKLKSLSFPLYHP